MNELNDRWLARTPARTLLANHLLSLVTMVATYEGNHDSGRLPWIWDRTDLQLGAGKFVAVDHLAGVRSGFAGRDASTLVGPALDQRAARGRTGASIRFSQECSLA